MPLKRIQLCPHLYVIFLNLNVVINGCNNELPNTLAYILFGILKITDLNAVWEGNLEAILFLFWFGSCDSQACVWIGM